MAVSAEFKEASKKLNDLHEQDLKKHNAFDMIAGDNFVAYLSEGEKGYKAEVYSWGVNHGFEESDDLETLKDTLFDRYD